MRKPKLHRNYCLFLNSAKYNRNEGCKAHDNAYGRYGGGDRARRTQVDRALYDHMKAQNDPMAGLAFLFVRIFGWAYFNYHGSPWKGQLFRYIFPRRKKKPA